MASLWKLKEADIHLPLLLHKYFSTKDATTL